MTPVRWGEHRRNNPKEQAFIYLNRSWALQYENTEQPSDIMLALALSSTIFHEMAHWLMTKLHGIDIVSSMEVDHGKSYLTKPGGEAGFYVEARIFGGCPIFRYIDTVLGNKVNCQSIMKHTAHLEF